VLTRGGCAALALRPIRRRFRGWQAVAINCGVLDSLLNNTAACTLPTSPQRYTIVMAEAVGLASALLTLVVFTFDASKSLYEAVSSFKSQRQAIKDVLADLDALVTVLATIRKRAQQLAEAAKLESLRQPLECCATTCKEMREMLDACSARSKDGQTSVRDWLKMRYREKSFDDMKNRLSSYKTTLIVAFQSINM
jgi:hypothetical protein